MTNSPPCRPSGGYGRLSERAGVSVVVVHDDGRHGEDPLVGAGGWCRGLAFGLAACLILGCDQDTPHSNGNAMSSMLLRVDVPEVLSTAIGDSGQIRFLRFISDADGVRSVERVSAVGTSDDGTQVLVADIPSCEIRFFRLDGGTTKRSIGRCGEGPGEFSMISGVELRDDTVYAMDPNRQLVQVLTPDGAEVRRFRIPDMLPDVPGRFSWAQMIAPDAYLFIRATNGKAGTEGGGMPDWRSPVIRLQRTSDGKAVVTGSSLRIPRTSEDVARASGFVHPLRACGRVDRQQGTLTNAVVTQRLAAETVVLDAKLEPTVRRATALPWTVPKQDTTFPGGWRWGIVSATVACGDEFYALGIRNYEGGDERVADSHGRLEIRRYDGSLVVARNWGDDYPGGLSIGAPRAVLGDTLVTLAVDEKGWQRLAVWVFRE